MMLSPLALVAFIGVQEAPPPAPAPAPVRIQGQIKEPKKVKDAAPEYPEDARRAGLHGMVILEAQIGVDGKVADVRTLKGVPPLTDAATKAVKKWRYTPTLLSGVPVPVIMTVTVRFNRTPSFNVGDLIKSLSSSNEFIRQAAAAWLGGARFSNGVSGSEMVRIRQELARLAGSDPSEQVKATADQSLNRLDAAK